LCSRSARILGTDYLEFCERVCIYIAYTRHHLLAAEVFIRFFHLAKVSSGWYAPPSTLSARGATLKNVVVTCNEPSFPSRVYRPFACLTVQDIKREISVIIYVNLVRKGQRPISVDFNSIVVVLLNRH